MMAKFLEALQNQNFSGEDSFANFDMDAFRRRAALKLRSAFRSQDEKSKIEFLNWLKEVRSIRNSDLNYQDKEAKLARLPNTETVMKTLKAVLDAAVNAEPENEKRILKTSLSGIGMVTSMMNWKIPALATIAIHQALPKFLLTPHFEIVATFLEEELRQMLKELPSSSSK
jgi:hypothetical protein